MNLATHNNPAVTSRQPRVSNMNPRLAIFVIALIAVVSGLVGMSLADNREANAALVLKAKAIELVDGNGRVRWRLRAEVEEKGGRNTGQPLLEMLDSKGRCRAVLGGEVGDTTYLELYTADESRRINIMGAPEGASVLLEDGKQSAINQTMVDGLARIWSERKGEFGLMLASGADSGTVGVHANKGRAFAAVQVTKKDGPKLTLIDDKGNRRSSGSAP
ncbi:MAG: hypothetical protein U1A27_01715 [Phycisphaerae bacterium]